MQEKYHITPLLESIPLEEPMREISELYLIYVFRKKIDSMKNLETKLSWDSFNDVEQPIFI